MTSAKRGRPKRNNQIQKTELLKMALSILDEQGPEGLSMRNLAAGLGVTPMALYHHVADRSALIRELSDWVYSGIVQDSHQPSSTARESIEDLLIAYHKAVVRHPNLTLAIFADPNAFSSEAKRITQALSDGLAESSLEGDARWSWLSCLVDYTHGSSIAIAMGCQTKADDAGFIKNASLEYAEGLKRLLNCVFAECCEKAAAD